MTEQQTTATPPLAPSQHMPQTVGMWGPEQPRPSRLRGPIGLGDVAWFVLWFLGFQVVVGFVLLAWATIDATRTGITDPQAVFDHLTEFTTTGPAVLVATVSQWGLFLGYPYFVSRRKGLGTLAKDYGFRFRLRTDIPLGVGIAAGAQVVFFGVNNFLVPALGIDQTGADNTGTVTDAAGPLLIFMIFAAVVMAPLTEEVLFRGFLLRTLMRRLGGWDDVDADGTPRQTRWGGAVASAVLTSLLFGLAHNIGGSTSGMLLLGAQTGLLGLAFALVTIRTRRLGAGIIGHAMFNGTSIALVLIFAA